MKTTRKTRNSGPTPPKVIGADAVYLGDEGRLGGYGSKVLISGVFRYDEAEDSPDRLVTCNRRLADLGGLRDGDGAEVHVWLPNDARWSFVADEVEDVTLLQISGAPEICGNKETDKEG